MKKYISIFLLIPLMACARPSSFSGTWSYTDQIGDTVGGKELVLSRRVIQLQEYGMREFRQVAGEVEN